MLSKWKKIFRFLREVPLWSFGVLPLIGIIWLLYSVWSSDPNDPEISWKVGLLKFIAIYIVISIIAIILEIIWEIIELIWHIICSILKSIFEKIGIRKIWNSGIRNRIILTISTLLLISASALVIYESISTKSVRTEYKLKFSKEDITLVNLKRVVLAILEKNKISPRRPIWDDFDRLEGVYTNFNIPWYQKFEVSIELREKTDYLYLFIEAKGFQTKRAQTGDWKRVDKELEIELESKVCDEIENLITVHKIVLIDFEKHHPSCRAFLLERGINFDSVLVAKGFVRSHTNQYLIPLKKLMKQLKLPESDEHMFWGFDSILYDQMYFNISCDFIGALFEKELDFGEEKKY